MLYKEIFSNFGLFPNCWEFLIQTDLSFDTDSLMANILKYLN